MAAVCRLATVHRLAAIRWLPTVRSTRGGRARAGGQKKGAGGEQDAPGANASHPGAPFSELSSASPACLERPGLRKCLIRLATPHAAPETFLRSLQQWRSGRKPRAPVETVAGRAKAQK